MVQTPKMEAFNLKVLEVAKTLDQPFTREALKNACAVISHELVAAHPSRHFTATDLDRSIRELRALGLIMAHPVSSKEFKYTLGRGIDVIFNEAIDRLESVGAKETANELKELMTNWTIKRRKPKESTEAAVANVAAENQKKIDEAMAAEASQTPTTDETQKPAETKEPEVVTKGKKKAA